MSAPGLIQVWSLDIPEDAPAAMNVDTWVANQIALVRVVASAMASQLSIIPPSETRLRDEGILPLYSLFHNTFITLSSIAHKRGVTIPDIPNAPEDWNEEASTDMKALSAQLRPHLVEPVRAIIDWTLGLRERNPELHWASRVAITSVSLELYIGMILAVSTSGMIDGSEWRPLVAQTTGDSVKGIARIIHEELLRIRAQPGSGWNEEEAKGVVQEQLGNKKELSTVGM